MNVREIDLQTWANVFENSVIASQHDDVALLVTRGRHPDLGAIVGVQRVDGMTLISEHPINDATSGIGEVAR